MKILVTGATGYIGGRLIPRLLDSGHDVRVLVRAPERAAHRAWSARVEVCRGDLLDAESLERACDGVQAAYYLVHSMTAGPDFAARDRAAAQQFVRAARDVSHTIYLGGLVPAPGPGARLSAHLESRAEVGAILRAGLPTTEFRAGPIIGSGSASFEMVRYLTERLPAMIAPRWILNEVQPIAVRDVLAYLIEALDLAEPAGVVDIGMAPLTFRRMMLEYARIRGLRRVVLPVPVLAPALAARWVGLVTPIPNRLAVPLVEGMTKRLVGDGRRAAALFPRIRPTGYREAVEQALTRTQSGDVATRWSGSVGGGVTVELEDREGIVREVRTRLVGASPERVFRTFSSLGGERGWLVWNWAWRLRGTLDRLLGGPGLRRGRRHPQELLPGEAVDFWRVEAVTAPELLRLRAEMKVPGLAWLEWRTEPEAGGTRLVQTASFVPSGLLGTLYWYGVYPLHALIFSSMVAAIAREAEASGRPGGTAPAPSR